MSNDDQIFELLMNLSKATLRASEASPFAQFAAMVATMAAKRLAEKGVMTRDDIAHVKLLLEGSTKDYPNPSPEMTEMVDALMQTIDGTLAAFGDGSDQSLPRSD